jgi:Uma2 family endonuclease
MASATKPVVSVEEYLRMSFEGPAPDFLDGELVERGEPVYSHSRTQGRCFRMLDDASRRVALYPGPEMRLRIGGNRIRVADVAAFKDAEPAEQIPSTPPFIVIEVVSRDDRYVDILIKLEEYRRWGVPHVWLVDPWLRKLNIFTTRLEEVERLEIPECEISIQPADLFE